MKLMQLHEMQDVKQAQRGKMEESSERAKNILKLPTLVLYCLRCVLLAIALVAMDESGSHLQPRSQYQ